MLISWYVIAIYTLSNIVNK